MAAVAANHCLAVKGFHSQLSHLAYNFLPKGFYWLVYPQYGIFCYKVFVLLLTSHNVMFYLNVFISLLPLHGV